MGRSGSEEAHNSEVRGVSCGVPCVGAAHIFACFCPRCSVRSYTQLCACGGHGYRWYSLRRGRTRWALPSLLDGTYYRDVKTAHIIAMTASRAGSV